MGRISLLVAGGITGGTELWNLLRAEGSTVVESTPAHTPCDCAIVVADAPTPAFHSAVSAARTAGIPRVYVVASSGSEELAIAALRLNVADYFRWPAELARLRTALSNAAAHPSRGAPAIVGGNPGIRSMRTVIARAASTDATVLVTGETGTGKELVAQNIHALSRRRESPFTAINCAAIPDTLVEGELFGHERGAFTGAHKASAGLLEASNGGTLFLDEIAELSPLAQAKILRVLESRNVQRLGSRRNVPLDVRVIAATNQDVEKIMEQGRFRNDLYYRLSVVRIHLPPLRDRKEDIPALIQHQVEALNQRQGYALGGFTPDALDALFSHDWPGNIRELRNVLESVAVSCAGGAAGIEHLPDYLRRRLANPPGEMVLNEKELLLRALAETSWNKSRAADKLHWSRMTLYRKLEKYNIAGVGNRGTTSE